MNSTHWIWKSQIYHTPVDIYLFITIMAAVLSYISPIYHTVSLQPHPSPPRRTIDRRRCNDKCNPLSNGQILQMSGAERISILIIFSVFMLQWLFRGVSPADRSIHSCPTECYKKYITCFNTLKCDLLNIWYKWIMIVFTGKYCRWICSCSELGDKKQSFPRLYFLTVKLNCETDN